MVIDFMQTKFVLNKSLNNNKMSNNNSNDSNNWEKYL
jgi:hypothetical protein